MRRDHKTNVQQVVTLPNKLFCLDFEDTVNNTTTKVRDTVNNIDLTKATAGYTTYITDSDFGRCLKTTLRDVSNVFTANWANIYQTIFGSGQTNWAQRPLTIVFFANTMTTAVRAGLMSIYNYTRLTGYAGYSGSRSYIAASWCGTMDINPVNYVGKTANSDIAMFVLGSDYANMKRRNTKLETGFTSLNEYTTSFTPYSATAGDLKFLVSQETSYYWPTDGIVAGFTIYDGFLTNEQVAYIFNNKII